MTVSEKNKKDRKTKGKLQTLSDETKKLLRLKVIPFTIRLLTADIMILRVKGFEIVAYIYDEKISKNKLYRVIIHKNDLTTGKQVEKVITFNSHSTRCNYMGIIVNQLNVGNDKFVRDVLWEVYDD